MKNIAVTSIYSKKNPEELLHQYICRTEEPRKERFTRVNLSPEEESLQSSYLVLPEGQTFKPHKHIVHERSMPIAQESWVIIEGSVEVTYYDEDDKIIEKKILKAGESTITYKGGHNYLSLEEETVVYELKTGPYKGQAYDKVFIELN